MKKLSIFFAIFLLQGNTLFAQVGINSDNSAPDSTAMLDVKSTTSGFLPPRMTTEQRNLIGTPATGLTIYNTTRNCIETYNGSAWVSNTHYIGENYGGGIVFYVYDDGRHGLIAAAADQSTAIQWYNGTNRNTGTTGDGLLAGTMNTAIIVVAQMADNQNGNFAAKVCSDSSVTVGGVKYDDWYLPSKHELGLLYLQKAVVGGFDDGNYWSSTESDASNAWARNFNSGNQISKIKNATYYVRAIRAF